MTLPSLKCKHQNALHIHSPVVIDVGRPPLSAYTTTGSLLQMLTPQKNGDERRKKGGAMRREGASLIIQGPANTEHFTDGL